MNDFKGERPYLPDEEAVIAYRKKLAKEMKEVTIKMEAAGKQPYKEEDIWATVGDLRYGHPVTPLIIQYRVLIWKYKNPPDPRGEPMYSQIGPYTMYVRRADMADVLSFDVRTIDRMLAEVREQAGIEAYGKITVQLFCDIHRLPEKETQDQLHAITQKRFKKHKPKG